jgi:NAD(P)-dependent dehydrogenase (short-subunit alcohol dehydrogenase family)
MAGIHGFSALVTGGGSGIGLGTAKHLAAEGAHVTICGRTEDRLRAAVDAIAAVKASGVTVQYLVADVTVEAQVVAAVAKACEASGRLDILFTNAGGSLQAGPIVMGDVEAVRATVDLNVVGTYLCIKHTAPVMARQGGGAIIGMSSLAGGSTHRCLAAYGASKAAVEMLCQTAADELGPSNIRVNCVMPGIIDDEVMQPITMGGPLLDDYLENMLIRRVGTVEDVAAAVRFLAGPESSWISGQTIYVDGGQHIRRGPNFGHMFEAALGADALRGLLPKE